MIQDLKINYCHQVANLHIAGIPTGFISSLGIDFVSEIYKAISEDENSFGFVVVDDSEVLGFVAFSCNLGKLYKYVLKKKFFKFAPKIALRMLSFSVFKKVLANILYPSKMKKLDLPDAELLSVVVAKKGRGRGLAGKLVQAGFEECNRRGIDKVKVLVAAGNGPANKMYEKCGFELFTQVESHGVLSNIYVAKLT